jgi:hypothetical protein
MGSSENIEFSRNMSFSQLSWDMRDFWKFTILRRNRSLALKLSGHSSFTQIYSVTKISDRDIIIRFVGTRRVIG